MGGRLVHLIFLLDVGTCFLPPSNSEGILFKRPYAAFFGESSRRTSQKDASGENEVNGSQQKKRRRSIDYPPFSYDGSVELDENQDDFSKVVMCLKEKGNCIMNVSWTNTTGADMELVRKSSDPDPSFENFFLRMNRREARRTRLIVNRAYAKSAPFANDNRFPPVLEDLSPPQPAFKDIFWISTTARLISFAVPYVVFPYIVQFLYGFESLSLSSTQLDEIASKFSPGVSILYGTFVSLTLSILYTRQQRIQDTVSTESALLAMITRNLIRIFRDDKESLIEAGQCIADQIRTLVQKSRGGELMVLMYSDPYSRILELVEKQEEKLEREQGNFGSQVVRILEEGRFWLFSREYFDTHL